MEKKSTMFEKLYSKGADQLYERIYSNADSPEELKWPAEVLNPLLVAYSDRDETPGTLLDLGAGPGLNAIKLAEMGYEVTAVEFVEKGVQWGRERANERNVDVQFIQADALEWEAPQAYDIVFDFGLMHGFSTEECKKYKHLLSDRMAADGEFFLSHFARQFPLDTYWPFGPRRRDITELQKLLPSDLELQAQTYYSPGLGALSTARMGHYWFKRNPA